MELGLGNEELNNGVADACVSKESEAFDAGKESEVLDADKESEALDAFRVTESV